MRNDSFFNLIFITLIIQIAIKKTDATRKESRLFILR